jgi:hypothetical protein
MSKMILVPPAHRNGQTEPRSVGFAVLCPWSNRPSLVARHDERGASWGMSVSATGTASTSGLGAEAA